MTSIADSVAAIGFASPAFTALDKAWESMPADKLQVARGTLSLLFASDRADEPDPSDPDFVNRPNHLVRLTLWRMGNAHILICAMDSFCDAFLSHLPFDARFEEAYRICDAMSSWFDRRGIRRSAGHRSVREVHASALARHAAGVEMRKMIDEARRSAQKR